MARELCVELLDVFSMDAASGYHRANASEDFHVPREASMSAALAALDMLRAGGSGGNTEADRLAHAMDSTPRRRRWTRAAADSAEGLPPLDAAHCADEP